MLRRSARLMSGGVQDPTPQISYREQHVEVSKKRGGNRKRTTSTSSISRWNDGPATPPRVQLRQPPPQQEQQPPPQQEQQQDGRASFCDQTMKHWVFILFLLLLLLSVCWFLPFSVKPLFSPVVLDPDAVADSLREKVAHVLEDSLTEIKTKIHMEIQLLKEQLDVSALRKEISEQHANINSLKFQLERLEAKNKEEYEARWSQGTDRTSPPADRMADFTLESQGGSVVYKRCSKTYNRQLKLFGFPLWWPWQNPSIVIQGHPVLPGRCWPLCGVQGQMVVALSHPVIITHVTLDHIPRSISPMGHINSAPRDFQVYGMNSEDEPGTLLGKFTYKEDGEATQTFQLNKPSDVHDHVELRILSNWGQIEYTCLYRFRVHGKVPST